jgi:hypothetical protein
VGFMACGRCGRLPIVLRRAGHENEVALPRFQWSRKSSVASERRSWAGGVCPGLEPTNTELRLFGVVVTGPTCRAFGSVGFRP